MNSVVFLLAFLLLDKINKEDMMSNIKIFFLIGLLLCTRTVFVLPLIVYFAYLLKRESISKVLLYGTVLVVAYLMPMLPFFAMWPNEMVSQNPYLTQGGNLIPFWSIIMLCLISLLFGFKSRNFKDVMWWSAVMLAMAGFAHILWISGIYTFPKAYFGNIADISYMLFSYVFFGYIFIESGKTNTETKFGEQTVYMG